MLLSHMMGFGFNLYDNGKNSQSANLIIKPATTAATPLFTQATKTRSTLLEGEQRERVGRAFSPISQVRAELAEMEVEKRYPGRR